MMKRVLFCGLFLLIPSFASADPMQFTAVVTGGFNGGINGLNLSVGDPISGMWMPGHLTANDWTATTFGGGGHIDRYDAGWMTFGAIDQVPGAMIALILEGGPNSFGGCHDDGTCGPFVMPTFIAPPSFGAQLQIRSGFNFGFPIDPWGSPYYLNANLTSFTPMVDTVSTGIATVPEPSTFALLGLGLVFLAWKRPRLGVLVLALSIPAIGTASGFHYDATFTGKEYPISYCGTCVMTGFSGPMSGSFGYTAGDLNGEGYLDLTIGQESFNAPLVYTVSPWEAPGGWYVVGQGDIAEIDAKAKVWVHATKAEVECPNPPTCAGVLPASLSYPYGAYLEIRDADMPFDFSGPFDYSLEREHYVNAVLTFTSGVPSAVPEPSTMLLVGFGIAAIAFLRR